MGDLLGEVLWTLGGTLVCGIIGAVAGIGVIMIYEAITKKKLQEEMVKRQIQQGIVTFVQGCENRVKLTDLKDESKSFTMEGTGIDDVRDGEILIA